MSNPKIVAFRLVLITQEGDNAPVAQQPIDGKCDAATFSALDSLTPAEQRKHDAGDPADGFRAVNFFACCPLKTTGASRVVLANGVLPKPTLVQ